MTSSHVWRCRLNRRRTVRESLNCDHVRNNYSVHHTARRRRDATRPSTCVVSGGANWLLYAILCHSPQLTSFPIKCGHFVWTKCASCCKSRRTGSLHSARPSSDEMRSVGMTSGTVRWVIWTLCYYVMWHTVYSLPSLSSLLGDIRLTNPDLDTSEVHEMGSSTGYTKSEYGFRFVNKVHFFTESGFGFTIYPNPDSLIEYPLKLNICVAILPVFYWHR